MSGSWLSHDPKNKTIARAPIAAKRGLTEDMARIAPLHIGHVCAAILMARDALVALGLTCRVRVMACRALSVTRAAMGALAWDRLVTIRTRGQRECVRLVARLTLVAMRARLDG